MQRCADGRKEIAFVAPQLRLKLAAVAVNDDRQPVPALLKRSTLLLLPSKAEGFGMALVEAQAVGLPCYASDAVPPEANLGGVRFLPLSDGPDVWARTILEERRFTQIIRCDCSAFSTGRFADAIRAAYRSSDSSQPTDRS